MPRSITPNAPGSRPALTQVTDAALAQIIALVDRLPHRPEQIEQMIASVRPRIGALRLARPLSFTRLLFLPMEGAIVPARAWQPGDATLPRNALAGIGAALRQAMGRAAPMMDKALAGRTFADRAAIGAVGTTLWAAGATLAPRLVRPADWPGTDAEFTALVRLSTSVWRHGEALWQALRHAPDSPPEHLVRHALRAAAEDPRAVSIVLATLLQGQTRPGTVTAAAREVSPAVAAAAEIALDAWIDSSIPAAADLSDPKVAARAAEQFGLIVTDLEESGCLTTRERRRRVNQLRAQMQQSCHDAFERAAKDYLGGRDPRTARSWEPDAAADSDGHIRVLGRLEAAGRRIGGVSIFDGMLRRLGGEGEAQLYRERLASIRA